MKLVDFEDWLNKFLNFEKTQKKNIFWLETMNFLCEKFNNPQNEIPCIHIAGSKGKGSTSVMIASILEEAGFRCGIYTSPHIIDFRENEGYFNSIESIMNVEGIGEAKFNKIKDNITT